MVISQWVAIIGILAASFAVWVGVVLLVPRNLRSIFRYRLWRLRDEVVDDVLAGRMPHSPLIRSFIGGVEGIIEHASHVTLLRALCIPVSPALVRKHRGFVFTHFRELSKDERAKYKSYEKSMRSIVMRRLLLGSVSGWAFLVAIFPVAYAVEVVKATREASLRAVLRVRYLGGRIVTAICEFIRRRQMDSDRFVTLQGIAQREDKGPSPAWV